MERREFITGMTAAALVADRALVQLADRAHMINCELGAEYAPTAARDALAHSCFVMTAVDWAAREITLETITLEE